RRTIPDTIYPPDTPIREAPLFRREGAFGKLNRSVRDGARPPAPALRASDPMNFKPLTRVLLVLLQLAIGWHFFYEGAWKLRHESWSSKGYLKNATGPVALPLRWAAGDPDVTWDDAGLHEVQKSLDVEAMLTPLPADPQGDAKTPAHLRMPEP